eukprot:157668_1
MVGQNRTKEFLEYIRVKTKGSSNSTSTNDTSKDSFFITTGKQMLFNIKQMHKMISENQSNYLDLNRFLNITTSITNTCQTSKHTHHYLNKQNKIWTEDDRFKFENQVLMFVKDITTQITNLSQLLENSDVSTDHDYILHQTNILKCLRFEVSSLSDKISHLIKERSKTLHDTHCMNNSNIYKQKINEQLDKFVDEIMKEEIDKKNKTMDEKINKISKIDFKTTKNDLSVLPENEEKYGGNGNGMDINMELSNMEIQEFKKENEEMIQLLEQEHKEVTAAEQKTAEIVDLLNLFTDQVINQESVVTSIGTAISGSLDNLELANKALEQANKRGKDTRTVFITVVLTLTFSLLFLDWYKS